MPSSLHEALVEIVRSSPARAIDLLRVAGIDVAKKQRVRIVDGTFSALLHNARSCDLAIETRSIAIVLEVQLRKDRTKELTWPLYWAALRARATAPSNVWLIVVTTHRATEAWAIGTLEQVIPPSGRWCVIGPSIMPRMTDQTLARSNPEATLLSGLIHAATADEDLVRAIATACSTIPPDRGIIFYDVFRSRLGPTAVAALERLMLKGYVFTDPWALRHQEIGRKEGQLVLARELLREVIRERGLTLTRVQRSSIALCSDLAKLKRWTVRAATVETGAAIFGRRARRA